MLSLAKPEEYAGLLMPAVVSMSSMPGYTDCFPALHADDAMPILLGHVQALADSQHTFLLVDKTDTGVCRGFTLGYIQPQWYSTELEGVQEFLWVEPEYRHGLTLRRLMRGFEQECAARGAAFIIIGTSSGYRPEAFARMAASMGYSPWQINFKKCTRR